MIEYQLIFNVLYYFLRIIQSNHHDQAQRTPYNLMETPAPAHSPNSYVQRTMTPRDLFDLHVLIEAEVPDRSSLLSNLANAPARLVQGLAELWPKIEAMTYAQFRSEVVPYLPAAVATAIDEASFDEIRLKVGENVEKWLRAATDSPEDEQ